MNNTIVEKSPLYFAKKMCDTLMTKFTPEELPPGGRWHYHQGVFLCGMDLVYNKTGEVKYFDYLKAYV
ncbi:glycoside hydrolase family 88 protein, partial [Aeromonas veronii]|nr:glycoside hydrolase family 88 protein [Aeromonas veronii]